MAETGEENQQGEVLASYVFPSMSSIKAVTLRLIPAPRCWQLTAAEQANGNDRKPFGVVVSPIRAGKPLTPHQKYFQNDP